MSYRRAEEILPIEIIEVIQRYVDGETIYIPRKENERKEWGHKTLIRQELNERNKRIVTDYKGGCNIQVLAEKYYLSEKSIQRILRESKNFSNKTKNYNAKV